jgi:hypothetical protein
VSRWTRLAVPLLALLLAAACGDRPSALVLGVAADRPAQAAGFADRVDAPVGIYQWYQAWGGQPDFDRERAQAAVDLGFLPLLTWEPWVAGEGEEQERYTLSRIAAGGHDAYLGTFARQVADWGGVLALRFAHELNAPHYPWSVSVNGNTPQDALAAWRHVREVFQREGADVVWVWSVNVSADDTSDYEAYYPGDDEVDWVGLDGYNGGVALPWGGWQSPEELLGDDLDRLDDLTDAPLLLTEVGSTEAGGDKAAWIRDLFRLAEQRELFGLVWFEYDKETDWRVVSSPNALAAFRQAAEPPGRVTATPRLPASFNPDD